LSINDKTIILNGSDQVLLSLPSSEILENQGRSESSTFKLRCLGFGWCDLKISLSLKPLH